MKNIPYYMLQDNKPSIIPVKIKKDVYRPYIHVLLDDFNNQSDASYDVSSNK